MERIAIFASGTGSNARKIMDFFQAAEEVEVALLCTDNPDAGALQHASEHGIPSIVLDDEQLSSDKTMLDLLEEYRISFIALAGYLKMIPAGIVRAFSKRIVNLHPALLPSFGGKGMYGANVHRSVLDSGAKQSGITVHLVNEEYDKGEIIFQTTCPVFDEDEPDALADRIHKLEHAHYPKVIHRWLHHLNSMDL